MNELVKLVTRVGAAGEAFSWTPPGKPHPHVERRGLWVVLLGPDGVGKSAVIAELAGERSTGFRGCATYHLRPTLLRRGITRVTNVDPHGQMARGKLISMFKLIYLLVLNWLGHLVAVRPQLARGNLILFDRYFPDCLVDPKRYRLPESCRRMTESIARFLPQPDLYVVLDAPATALQQRKREVPLAESERQRTDYATRFEKLPHGAIVDATRPLTDVAAEVLDRITELRLLRYRQRYEVA